MTSKSDTIFPNDYPYEPRDIRIDTGRSTSGTFIRAVHIPSSRARVQDGLRGERPKMVERKLLALLHADIALPAHDIQIIMGWGEQGAFTQVTHLPTQAARWQKSLYGSSHADVESCLLRQLENDVHMLAHHNRKVGDKTYIWADFNAGGGSEETGDASYYVLHPYKPKDSTLFDGMEAFIFDFDNIEETEIVGCDAVIERYKQGWRASPLTPTWYSGPCFWR